MTIPHTAATMALAAAVTLGCASSNDPTQLDDGNTDSGNNTDPTGGTDLGGVYAYFHTNVEISVDGSTVVIRSDGVPTHNSPYFNTTDSRYEAYNGTNARFMLNPNRIREQQLTFRLPIGPSPASLNTATPLGPIGVSLNGVPIFNQYAGPNRPLTDEIDTFDHYNGHPQQTGQYHYHVQPVALTAELGEDALIGVLLDGYPVYGPLEDGVYVTNADLDALHGHVGPTADFPDGIYHYHITSEDPYINGAGFYGTAGTVSQ